MIIDGKLYFIGFYSVNVTEIWAHLAEKSSRLGAKSLQYFNRIIIKTFQKHLFYLEQQNHVMLFKVSF